MYQNRTRKGATSRTISLKVLFLHQSYLGTHLPTPDTPEQRHRGGAVRCIPTLGLDLVGQSLQMRHHVFKGNGIAIRVEPTDRACLQMDDEVNPMFAILRTQVPSA